MADLVADDEFTSVGCCREMFVVRQGNGARIVGSLDNASRNGDGKWSAAQLVHCGLIVTFAENESPPKGMVVLDRWQWAGIGENLRVSCGCTKHRQRNSSQRRNDDH